MNISIKTISYDARARIFVILAVLSVVSIGIYIYGIEATVQHTVARQSLQTQLSTLTTHVSELQFNDIALNNNISLDEAHSLGFQDISNPLYISRTHSLSFNALPE